MARREDVRKQLITLMDRYKFEIVSCGNDYNRIRKCIVAASVREGGSKHIYIYIYIYICRERERDRYMYVCVYMYISANASSHPQPQARPLSLPKIRRRRGFRVCSVPGGPGAEKHQKLLSLPRALGVICSAHNTRNLTTTPKGNNFGCCFI